MSVVETFAQGGPWPTLDPFLFCAHHLDHYPAATAACGPRADLSRRSLGSDFSGADGWSMYHGLTVPGFPQHPHRGFETITYARHGLVDHADSLGALARYGRGDVQWMTAGRGIVHAEMFPLLDRSADNPLEVFQVWLNLPARDKMAPAHFELFWASELPVLVGADGLSTLTLIAGEIDGVRGPTPPPESWAGDGRNEVAIWHLRLEAGARRLLPPTRFGDTRRVLYQATGSGLRVAGTTLAAGTGAVLAPGTEQLIEVDEPAEVLVLQGRPIGEPVAHYGPFVMNDRAGIAEAFSDYQRTGFGGWPWPADDPVHGNDPARFARHPDGAESTPAA